MSRCVPTRPLSSTNRIQRDMSATLDHTDPAGATASVLRIGTTRTVSRTRSCGAPTSGLPTMSATRSSVSRMPSGVIRRARRKVSHGMPEMRSINSPPIEYTTFW